MKTFAQSVIEYLDQYRAEQKKGRFISVDPDGDGEKHAIFVTDNGQVNPKGGNPGQWNNYKPQESDDSKKPLSIKTGPKIDAFEKVPKRTNKDGTPRKNSKAKMRLAPGIKGVFKLDKKTGRRTNLDSSGRRIERKVVKFEDAAKEYGFPADVEVTPQKIQELRQVAKEVQENVNAERAEIVDAMRQLFGDNPRALTAWQARARSAQDIKDLERFGIDRIISAQEYSDAESNLLPILAAHANLPGNPTVEDTVFAALRKPLPKPLALSHPYIVELAGERLAEADGEIEEEEYVEDGTGIFGDYDPEDLTYEGEPEYDDESVPFQAKSFADAVAYYQAKRNRDKGGRFIAVDPDGDGEKHVIYVDDDGTVNPNSKKPGKWKGYKAPKTKDKPATSVSLADSKLFTESMEKARAKLSYKYGTERIGQRGLSTGETRKTLNTYRTRLSESGKFGVKAKPEEMTQIEFVADQLSEINDKRKQFLNKNNELGAFLQAARKELAKEKPGSHSYKFLTRETYNRLLERDDSQKFLAQMEKRTNGGEPGAGYANLLWLGADLSGNNSLFEHLQPQYAARGVLKLLQAKHRDKVRLAIQNDPSRAQARAYDEYFDAPWYPGNKAEKKRAAVKYCKKVDAIKKGDKFRLNASAGRKYKKQANDAIDGMRKAWHKKFVDGSKKLHDDFSEARKKMHEIGDKLRLADPDSTEFRVLRNDYEAANKAMDVIFDQHKTLASQSKAALIDAIQKLPSNRRRTPQQGNAIEFDDRRSSSAQQMQQLESAVSWLEAVSGGAISSMNVQVLPTRERRSFHSVGNIYMNKADMTLPVLIHELGHAIDYSTDQHRFTKAFEAQAIQKHPTRWTGAGCEKDEVGSKNGFLHSYSGKYYDRPRSSEVMSMGLQLLYQDPVRFASESPDHFNFTVANIRGLLNG